MFTLYLAASTQGQEFYIGFLSNIGGGSFSNLQIVVGTPDTSAEFKVESSNGVIHEGTVTFSEPVALFLDRQLQLQVTSGEFVDRQKGLHIYSTGSESIYVLVKNYVTFINFGAYLAYPCQTFETDSAYEYFVISVDSAVALSQFLLVGCENDTAITVIPTQMVSIPRDPQDRLTASTTIESGATSHQLILHEMQTLPVSSVGDLTGTKIISNKPLTVISGHECANVPSTRSGCEPLAVQIPPTFTWGTEFLLSPFTGRFGAQTFKAVTSENNTFFTAICGTSSHENREDTVFQFDTDEHCYLKTSKPVLLIQLSFGGSVDKRGDPAVAMISPIDQYIHETDFFSLPTSEFSNNYISITVTAEHYNPDSILLDGTKINCEWKEIYNNTVSFDIVGYGCSAIISSESRSHTQHKIAHSNANGLISVLAYGFSAFPAQGYAYLTGQELKVANVQTGKYCTMENFYSDC